MEQVREVMQQERESRELFQEKILAALTSN